MTQTVATPAAVPAALHVLLRGIVDYAGLFPPASLDMAAAASQYAGHRAGPDAWALGRFVLPAARLDEFESAAQGTLPLEGASSWALSALLGSDIEEDIQRIERFNARHGDARSGAVVVDTVELKTHTARDVAHAGDVLDRRFDTYMEIPGGDAPLDELVAAIARTTAKAKIRTGGVTADAFPSATYVARFLSTCISNKVAFKATAGLHHPWRGDYPLTYAPNAPSAAMFGFLNVALAVSILCADPGHGGEALAVAALEERAREAFRFDERAAHWRGRDLPVASLARARESLSAFGSCSFNEPVDDLRAMHLL